MIVIAPYSPQWPLEFNRLAAALAAVLGELAVRIDHIGSTAVPGLAAKDVIDIQVSVRALEPAVEAALASLGYERLPEIAGDHRPPQAVGPASDWQKWFFRPPAAQRRTNLHVRVAGRPNQRYPLLFRDYLRAHPAAAEAYGQIKQQLARHHPDDMEAYYDIKDPACDLIWVAARSWAAASGWTEADAG
jgi:GrpB-like predicted nucleotidyltransferase (UPF0157 family)